MTRPYTQVKTMNPFTAPLEIQRRMLTQGTDAAEKMRLLPNRLEDLASVEVGQTPSEGLC